MDRFIRIDVHKDSCTVAVMGPTGSPYKPDQRPPHRIRMSSKSSSPFGV